MTNLNQQILLRLAVPLAPRAEQPRVVDEVERQESVGQALKQNVAILGQRYRTLRQSILKWAFEGKLVDQDPNDEPAEKLLERIRAERAATTAANVRPRKLARTRKSS